MLQPFPWGTSMRIPLEEPQALIPGKGLVKEAGDGPDQSQHMPGWVVDHPTEIKSQRE